MWKSHSSWLVWVQDLLFRVAEWMLLLGALGYPELASETEFLTALPSSLPKARCWKRKGSGPKAQSVLASLAVDPTPGVK